MHRHKTTARIFGGMAAWLVACSAGGGTDTPPETSPPGMASPTPTGAAVSPTPSSPQRSPSPTPAGPTPTHTPGATPIPTPTLTPGPTPDPTPTWCEGCGPSLRVNEVVADNEGAWIDGEGETDDLFEIINASAAPLSTAGWTVGDDDEDRHPLPARVLAPGETWLLWADGEVEQGEDHLPFKLSASGEAVYLRDPDGALVDLFEFPSLAVNDSYARFPDGVGAPMRCRFASPGRPNGDACEAPPPPDVVDDVAFSPYTWPRPWPAVERPLTLNEIALKPAAFIEVANTSSSPVALSSYRLGIAPHLPGDPWPPGSQGLISGWPSSTTLAPGEHIAVSVTEAEVAALKANAYEGVVTLSSTGGAIISRLDFMAWPQGGILARQPDVSGPFAFCQAATRGEKNLSCDPLAQREVGSYLRHFFTPGDWAALSYGDPKLGIEQVKAVEDMQTGDHIYLLDSLTWDLHYTFVREVIEGKPHLDRCDPAEASQFNQGWYAFSVTNYYNIDGRRYLLGTLNRFGTNGLRTLEFSTGDVINAPLMKKGFFDASARFPDPTELVIRAQDTRQVDELLTIDGQLPAVGPNAPYEGMHFQALNEGTAYGILSFIPADALASATLGEGVIVVTDVVPLDIDLVGGLITEAFQTPLSHVAVLSRNRGTPNMALTGARSDDRITPWLGQLVRLDVLSGDFTLRAATSEEAVAFWESHGGERPVQIPDIDPSRRGLVDLEGAGHEDLPAIGAKAALFAELYQASAAQGEGDLPIRVPPHAFAVPVSAYLDHFEASGARARLAALRADPGFQADPAVRRAGLQEVQQLIRAWPVDPALLQALATAISTRWGEARVRLRSSSNTEDIQGFSGAGLYTSVSVALGDDDLPLDDGLRTVWASLWNPRAYEERSYFNVDQGEVAMGVLAHAAFISEEANGVGISRNITDPFRGSTYYLTAQEGEATVTNPAPGVAADEFLYRFGGNPPEQYLSRSSFTDGAPVLTAYQRYEVAYVLRDIHDFFRAFLDPLHEEAFFAVDIEFKYVDDGAGGQALWVKQARPYNFGDSVVDPCAEE